VCVCVCVCLYQPMVDRGSKLFVPVGDELCETCAVCAPTINRPNITIPKLHSSELYGLYLSYHALFIRGTTLKHTPDSLSKSVDVVLTSNMTQEFTRTGWPKK